MEEIWVLKKIKINDELQDVVAKSTDDYVTVVYDGQKITLAKALSNIKEEIKKILWNFSWVTQRKLSSGSCFFV